MTNKFAERLKKLIKENNLRYKDIEVKTNIKAYTIRNYVNKICEPDIKSLVLLANFFKVSTDYLVGYSDSIYPEFIKEALDNFEQAINQSFRDFHKEIEYLTANHKRRC